MDTEHKRITEAEKRTGDSPSERRPGRLRRFVLGGTELLLAIILVFVFFLTFLGIIGFSFPQGTSLRNLMVQPRWGERLQPVVVTRIDAIQEDADASPIEARLVSTRRLVKAKDSHDIAWSNAQSGMELHERDSVQTFDRSSARIDLGQDNRVDLGENSLIVLRRPDLDPGPADTRAMITFDGYLSVNAEDEAAYGSIEIAMSNGASAILPDGASGSRLVVTTDADNTSTFSVHSGSARIVSGGREIELSANQAITVDGVAPPTAPLWLPARPTLSAPADGSSLTYRSAAPLVRLEWDGRAECDAYRVSISRDPDFASLVYEGEVGATTFDHGNLAAGSYYWKVSGISGELEGPASAARRLDLHRDDVPPPLSVELPDRTSEGRVLITGATEPGAEIFIGDQNVAAGVDGVFEYAVNLERGVNLVVVEAIDAAGNVAYRSELIHAKY